MTDEELKALVERLDHHNCECVVLDAAASAISQIMKERDEVLKIANQCAIEWEDASTVRDRIAAFYAGARHPPTQS